MSSRLTRTNFNKMCSVAGIETTGSRRSPETLVIYLRSLRAAKNHLAQYLVVSLWLELVGIAITAVLGLLIVANAS
jgi:hypothetical protein